MNWNNYRDAIHNNPRYQPFLAVYTGTDVSEKTLLERTRNIPLLNLMARRTIPEKEPKDNTKREKTERFGVLDGLKKYQKDHVLLVGKPGSGKSTALIRLLLETVEGLAKQEINKIPILVELRYYKNSILDLIQDFLQEHGVILNSGEIEALLNSGKCLLLFDGVNELPSEAAYDELKQFRKQRKNNPMIFTTRQLGLRGDLEIGKKLTMESLTESQMKAFVKRYLGEDEGTEMIKQLENRLKEFGETPLLLWMLCSVLCPMQKQYRKI